MRLHRVHIIGLETYMHRKGVDVIRWYDDIIQRVYYRPMARGDLRKVMFDGHRVYDAITREFEDS